MSSVLTFRRPVSDKPGHAFLRTSSVIRSPGFTCCSQYSTASVVQSTTPSFSCLAISVIHAPRAGVVLVVVVEIVDALQSEEASAGVHDDEPGLLLTDQMDERVAVLGKPQPLVEEPDVGVAGLVITSSDETAVDIVFGIVLG